MSIEQETNTCPKCGCSSFFLKKYDCSCFCVGLNVVKCFACGFEWVINGNEKEEEKKLLLG